MAETLIPAPQGGGGGGSVLGGRAAHFKILILCLVCTLVYLYLYSEVSVQTLRIQELMEGTLEDFQAWKDSMENWVLNLKRGDANKHLHNSVTKALRASNSSVNTSHNSRHVILDVTDDSMAKRKKEYLQLHEQTDIPLLTLFTTWPSKPDKYLCHNNTVNNLVVVTTSCNSSTVLKRNRPCKRCEEERMEDNLVASLKVILTSESVNNSVPMMIVGQRTNVKDVTLEEASSWVNIEKIAKSRGKLFTSYAEDFFITMKNYPWKEIPELVIGRRAYDNWLVLNARKRKFTTVDITATSYAVHQTTKAGNFEGHNHKDGNYNHNLLRKLYRRLRYEAGLTTCTDKQTRRTADRQILVQSRKISRGCFPI
ncbi:hypothetical protein FSP39_004155 [Pinctada imbricata]|uniref:Uncharacterized protein n=1 Tax=Pinctada imbricata TaxID=66713 RepID=A0AA88XHJ1_PINIB|nr:hypothetical protein FSP39_004155 [Pinctada imbricata]